MGSSNVELSNSAYASTFRLQIKIIFSIERGSMQSCNAPGSSDGEPKQGQQRQRHQLAWPAQQRLWYSGHIQACQSLQCCRRSTKPHQAGDRLQNSTPPGPLRMVRSSCAAV